MNKLLATSFILLALVMVLGLASSDTAWGVSSQLSIAASKDNTLYESATGTLSNGAGAHLFAGKTAAGNLRRGVIAFDLASNIPDGAVIVDAKLTLHASRTRGGSQSISLHRVLSDWGEGTSDASGQEGAGAPATAGDATWIHTFWDNELWADSGGQPGGHYLATPSSMTAINGTGNYEWSGETMVKDAQSWLDDPDQNYGWILVGEEDTSGQAVRFDSRQHPTAQVQPRLVIQYFIPTASLYLPLIGTP